MFILSWQQFDYYFHCLPPVSTTLAKLIEKFAAGVVATGGKIVFFDLCKILNLRCAHKSLFTPVHGTDLIDGHVHPDEPLVRHLVWTLLPKPEWRINVLQQLHGFRVVDGAAKTDKNRFF
jgi:hypothetical protein